jgi:acetate---CoA ligase (ADP-forming)
VRTSTHDHGNRRTRRITLGPLLTPASVAIVGASPNTGYGARLYQSASRASATARVYPVNPKYTDIRGTRCYPSVGQLPEVPECCAIAVPAGAVIGVLEECENMGTRAAIIVSAGFGESGPEGRELQARLQHFVRSTRMQVCGPNCLGTAHVPSQTWLCALDVDAPPGTLSMISQSGATAFATLMPRAAERGIGLRYVISTGNEAGLEFADFLEYLADDPGTTVVAGVVEGFKDPARFRFAAKALADSGKSLVLVKIGRSVPGAKAALSHTASVTGRDEIWDAVFEECGVIRVGDYDELIDVVAALDLRSHTSSLRCAIVSHSGGLGSLAADVVATTGTDIATLSDATVARLATMLGPRVSPRSPLDVSGRINQPESFNQIAELVISDPGVDILVVVSGGQANQLRYLDEAADRHGKSVAYCSSGSWTSAAALAPHVGPRVRMFLSPARLGLAMGAISRATALASPAAVQLPAADDITRRPRDDEQLAGGVAGLRPRSERVLGEYESLGFLGSWGIPVASEILAGTAEEAVAAASKLGYPVVLKLRAADVVHKAAVGGVETGLRTATDVALAFERIRARLDRYGRGASFEGTVVARHISSRGAEVILGFGPSEGNLPPVLIVGQGGLGFDRSSATARRVCPVTHADALVMARQAGLARPLAGTAGSPAPDLEALARAVTRLSDLAIATNGVVSEVDINPVILLPDGVLAVDATIIFPPEEPTESGSDLVDF